MNAHKKWIRRALIALLASYALYLLAVHALISTPLLRRLANKRPDKFQLEYGSAWSLYPGHLRVNALSIRMKDSVAEVYISADRVKAHLSLIALAKRTIRAHDVVASGVAVRVRPRVYKDEFEPIAMEGMAEIPGFNEPPFRDEKVRELPKLDKMWTVDMSDVTIEPLRELWIGAYRYAGDARVTGGFYVKPLQQFELRYSRFEARSGELTLGKRAFGQDVHGTIESSIALHDPRGVDGTEMLRFLDAKLELASTVEDLGFGRRWLLPPTQTTISGGNGRAESRMRIEKGVVQDGSVLTIKSDKVLVRRPPLSAWLDANLEIRVDKGEARVHLVWSDVRIARRFAESYPLKSEQLSFLGVTKSLDLARKPFDDALVSFDAPRITMTDVRALEGLVGKDVHVGPGVAYLKAHVDLSVRETLMQGEISFDAPKLSVKMPDVAFAARVALGGRFTRLDLSTMTASVPHAYFDVRDAVLAGKAEAPPPAWWGRVDLLHGTLDSAQKPAFAGDLEAKARDARPIIYIATAKKPLPEIVREPLAMEGLKLQGKLHIGPGVAIENLNGEGGSIDIKGQLQKKDKQQSGFITLSYGPFALTIKILPPKPAVGGGPQPK